MLEWQSHAFRAARWMKACSIAVVVGLAACVLVQWRPLAAQTPAAAAVAIDADDIGGVVTGPSGPEAGVWVIAETNDLSTKFRKIVVTDDQGRYVLPDLPAAANYVVWVRGYGLIDSPKVKGVRGKQLNLTSVPAPSPKAAAEYYPASYWLSLMRVPPEDQFPMPQDVPPPPPPQLAAQLAARGGRGGNAMIQSQADLVFSLKNLQVRQLGSKMTREIPEEIKKLGYTTAIDALQYGATAGQQPDFAANGPNLRRIADWVDRIAAGELPPAPARPQGIERNVVVTLWDVSNESSFVHDIVSTDKRNPALNANGKIYGIDFHHDTVVVLDPKEHVDWTVPIPAQVNKDLMRPFGSTTMVNPSIVWGDEVLYQSISDPNNITMDEQGRLWLTATVNQPDNPAFCKEGSANKYAQVYPIAQSGRHIAMYDPKTNKFKLIQTCFRTHHIGMSVVGPRRVFINPSAGANEGAYFGWLDLDTLEKTNNDQGAQGWCKLYFDTDGDGKPNRERPGVPGGPYSYAQNPVDGSIWGAVQGVPGHLARLVIGSNPPETCVGEMFEPPFDPYPSRTPGAISGMNPRGVDIDSAGVVWTALASSNQIASFDRRLCNPSKLVGELATTGRQCPEGWKLYPIPGPKMQGVTAEYGSDFNYYNFVDKFNTFGLGNDTPLANGTISDAIYALDKKTGKILTLRVPYPIGFYSRGMDGRIDDPNTGWKGRGLWATNGTRNIWHSELGKGSRGHTAHFQLRPDPLAK